MYCKCSSPKSITNSAYGQMFQVCSKKLGGCGCEINNVTDSIRGIYVNIPNTNGENDFNKLNKLIAKYASDLGSFLTRNKCYISFIENIVGNENSIKSIFSSESYYCIIDCFTWANSKEGEDFWYNICKDWEKTTPFSKDNPLKGLSLNSPT